MRIMEEQNNTQINEAAQQPINPDEGSSKKPHLKRKKLLLIIAVALAVVIVGLTAFALTKEDKSNKSQVSNKAGSSSDENPWLAGCSSNERVKMSKMPMDIADVQSVTPIGLTAGAHVTPIDHLYFYPKDMRNRDASAVYAMADGYVVDISKREVNVDSGTKRPAEWRIAVQHSCQTVSYFDLMTSLDKDLEAEYNQSRSGGVNQPLRIAVKAGQEVGRVGAQSLDTAVYNFSMKLTGFISPEKYKGEFWKVHTDDFFSYFEGADKQAMLAKSIRKVEPLGGKIDYDKPGKLIGNWFREGTDYFGDGGGSVSSDGKRGYWTGHLAVFPFVADGTSTIVSLGEYGDGSPKAFAVKGNTPDPATIDKASGIVAYELIDEPRFTPTGQITRSSGLVQATVLFQVLDGEKMKMEVFPGKTKAQATAFTADAKTYER